MADINKNTNQISRLPGYGFLSRLCDNAPWTDADNLFRTSQHALHGVFGNAASLHLDPRMVGQAPFHERARASIGHLDVSLYYERGTPDGSFWPTCRACLAIRASTTAAHERTTSPTRRRWHRRRTTVKKQDLRTGRCGMVQVLHFVSGTSTSARELLAAISLGELEGH